MSERKITETTEDICTLCGGRGQERNMETTAMFTTCRQCQGRGYIVTRRVTRTVMGEEGRDD